MKCAGFDGVARASSIVGADYDHIRPPVNARTRGSEHSQYSYPSRSEWPSTSYSTVVCEAEFAGGVAGVGGGSPSLEADVRF